MDAWQLLKIAPTGDARAIKRAYAKQLKTFDSEAEPQRFIALREALEDAQYQARYLLDEDDIQNPQQVTHAAEPYDESRLEHNNNQIISADLEGYFAKSALPPSPDDAYDDEHNHYADSYTITPDTTTPDTTTPNTQHLPHDLEHPEFAELSEDALLVQQLDLACDYLWHDDLSQTSFDTFAYVLKHLADSSLDVQMDGFERLQYTLNHIQIDNRWSEFKPFLDIWLHYRPIDEYAHYDDQQGLLDLVDYYAEQARLYEDLSPTTIARLNLLLKNANYAPWSMLVLLFQLKAAHPDKNLSDYLAQFEIAHKHSNRNYIFVYSLLHLNQFIPLFVVMAFFSFDVLNFFGAPDRAVYLLMFTLGAFILGFAQPLLLSLHDGNLRAPILTVWLGVAGLLLLIHPFLAASVAHLLTIIWVLWSLIVMSMLVYMVRAKPFGERLNQFLTAAHSNFERYLIMLMMALGMISTVVVFFIKDIQQPQQFYFMLPILLMFGYTPVFNFIFGYIFERFNPQLAGGNIRHYIDYSLAQKLIVHLKVIVPIMAVPVLVLTWSEQAELQWASQLVVVIFLLLYVLTEHLTRLSYLLKYSFYLFMIIVIMVALFKDQLPSSVALVMPLLFGYAFYNTVKTDYQHYRDYRAAQHEDSAIEHD